MKLYFNKRYLQIIILALVFLTSTTGLAFAQDSEKIDYVALGDSLAAGYTPESTIDKSYADFIAGNLNDKGILGYYKNYGVPGYTTDDVLASIDYRNPRNTQRISAISNAEIITLDIGANDLMDSILALLNDPTKAPAAIKKVAGNIDKITIELKRINPHAKIYLMGYYNAFPYCTKGQQALVIPLIEEFNSAVKQIAFQTGETYVDTYTIMDKHLAEYIPEDNIHPGLSGYMAIAKEFWTDIKVDFLKYINHG